MFANQERVFRQHIKLALKTEKPMVLHLRGPNSLGKLNQKIYTTVRPRNNAALICAIFGIQHGFFCHHVTRPHDSAVL